MKKKRIQLILMTICVILTTSCTTSVIGNDPDAPGNEDDGTRVALRFKIVQNNYTRAYDSSNDNEIESLTLAFYKIESSSSKFLYTVKAEQGNVEDTYTANINPFYDTPNAVIAFANLPENVNVDDVLKNKPTLEVLQNGDNIIMSSARYYDTDNGNADVFYSKITDDNISGEPVQIYLERVCAKVSVSLSNTSLASLSVCKMDNAKRSMNLILTKWDVMGTDKSTYLIKQTGNRNYQSMNNLIGPSWSWNDVSNHTFSWAKSVSEDRNSSDFPKQGKENGDSYIKLFKYDEVSNEYGQSNIFHETTRISSVFSTPNARPFVVLAGYYTIDNLSAPQTLYRRGDYVLNLDEICEYIININKQKRILFEEYKKLVQTKEKVKELIDNSELLFVNPSDEDITIMPNMVTLVINREVNKPILWNADGSYELKTFDSDFNSANETLQSEFGLWEIYEDGNCFFTIPIEHAGKNFDANGTKTGSYGLVRNHFYNISVKSISSIGNGVKKDAYIGEWQIQESNDAVSYNVTVNPWTEVNQDINK